MDAGGGMPAACLPSRGLPHSFTLFSMLWFLDSGIGALDGSYTGLMTKSALKARMFPAFFLSLLLLAACSGTRRPVLFPDAHYLSVGDAAARADVDDCMRLADEFGAPVAGGEEIARDTLAGAAIGGAAAAAWGAVRNDHDVGNRAAAGAAAGGAAGLVRGSLRAGTPSGTYKNFVNRCLGERGYDVIGWQ